MKISKFFFLLSLSIIFYSINLNAMETQTPENFLAKIKQYAETHKQRVSDLKQETNPKVPEELFALTLMLEEEIAEGKTEGIQNLHLIKKFPISFQKFINKRQLKDLMYWLLNHAAYNDQIFCLNMIYKIHSELFESSIFSRRAQDNDNLLKLLMQEGHIDSLRNLINKRILNWTQNKSELRKLAQEKSFEDVYSVLAQKIKEDHLEMCQDATIITLSLSLLILYYLLT